MAKKVASENGHNRLQDAITLLIQNKAALTARLAGGDKRHANSDKRLAESDKRQAENDKRQAENERLRLENERRWFELKQQSDERFARIEKDLRVGYSSA